MSRGARLALGLLAALAVLLAVNALVVGNQTKAAETTIEGGRLLSLPGGQVQVVSEGPTAAGRRQAGAPIVLVHCYACSLHWWDRVAPLLARRHRVIRIDLLGFGGSEKPSGGYAIAEQGALVAAALNELGVQGAIVVGHSMGFAVSVALAEQASQLVDRLVNVGEGPSMEQCELPLLARVSRWPVLGEALWRITPSFLVEEGYSSAFAPGFEIADGFPNPDQVSADHGAMTFTSYSEAHEALGEYMDEAPLDDRVARIAVPLLSVFGTEDQICDPEASQEAYATVPGARVAEVKGAGHSPNVEQPAYTAKLIEAFAAQAGPEGAAQRRPRRR